MLWRVEHISHNSIINNNEIFIIKSSRNLWDLNNRPKLIIDGEMECKRGSMIQLVIKAQLIFPNNETYQYSSYSKKSCMQKIEKIQIELQRNFNKLPLFHKFEVVKLESSYTLKNVNITWYNASP